MSERSFTDRERHRPIVYDQILVPTDGSEPAETGARHGCLLAAAFDATVTALGVVDTARAGLFETDTDHAERLRENAESGVRRVEEIGASSDVAVETSLVEGAPVETILDRAESADLISMGTHGRTGIERVALGSVTERVLRHAPVPVVTARPDAPADGYEEVLVPTDGSETATAAVDHAIGVAEATDATVHALHVVDLLLVGRDYGGGAAPDLARSIEKRARADAERVAERAREAGLTANRVVETGFPAGEIVSYIDRAGIDLAVMGTTGRTGLNRVFLGSTTERVIRNAACPVMAVNAREE